MKKENRKDFLKLFAAFAAVAMFFVFLDNPGEVFESIINTLGF